MVADMRGLELPADEFAAVVALYSVIHIPRADQAALFSKVHRWLQPDGYFLVCLSSGDLPAGRRTNGSTADRCSEAATTPTGTRCCTPTPDLSSSKLARCPWRVTKRCASNESRPGRHRAGARASERLRTVPRGCVRSWQASARSADNGGCRCVKFRAFSLAIA